MNFIYLHCLFILSVLYKQKTIRSKVISWWSPARPHFVGWWSHWDHHSQLSTGAHLRPTVQKDINTRTNDFCRDFCSLSTPSGYRKTTKATIFYSSAYEAHFCKQSIFAFNFFCHTLIYVTPIPKLEITDLEVGWVDILYIV